MRVARPQEVYMQILYPAADHKAAQERVCLQKLRLEQEPMLSCQRDQGFKLLLMSANQNINVKC